MEQQQKKNEITSLVPKAWQLPKIEEALMIQNGTLQDAGPPIDAFSTGSLAS